MNKTITRWNLNESEDIRREMGELELLGAVAVLYHLLDEYNKNEHGESYTKLDDVDSDTYYVNKRLEITGDGYVLRDDDGKLIFLDHVYMIEGNTSDLYGKACDYDDYDPDSDDNEFFTVCI